MHLDVLVAQAAVGHAASGVCHEVRLLVVRQRPVQPRAQVAEIQPHLRPGVQTFRVLDLTFQPSPASPAGLRSPVRSLAHGCPTWNCSKYRGVR